MASIHELEALPRQTSDKVVTLSKTEPSNSVVSPPFTGVGNHPEPDGSRNQAEPLGTGVGTTSHPVPGTSSRAVPVLCTREPLNGSVSASLEGILKSESELLALPATEFLVDDLIVDNSIVNFVGAGNSFKSFTALDLAVSIAGNQPTWLGRPLRRHGPVIYIIGEGRGRFKYRLLACKRHHNVNTPMPFMWTNGPINFTETYHGDLQQLIDSSRTIKPVLIVVDTLARCFGDEDENATAAMGRFVTRVDKLRQASGATILILHHTNASGTRERGNTSLRNAVETQISFHPTEAQDEVRLECDRQRESEYFDDMHLSINVVQVEGERDQSGKTPTSVVLNLLPPMVERVNNITQIQTGLQKKKETAAALIRAYPTLSANEIADELGGRRQEALRIVKNMKEGGAR